MARKPVFTESQVIDAVEKLNQNSKRVNGTNLRLEVGSGSPQKLLETYNKLLAKGIVKDKSCSEAEALELQLESSLEQLARTEEALDMVKVQASILGEMFTELSSYIPDAHYYEIPGILPFKEMNKKFFESIRKYEVNLIDNDVLFTLRKWLLKREREEAIELSQLSGNPELFELEVALAKERYNRKCKGLDTKVTSKEVELKSKIEEMKKEIRKQGPSLKDFL